ncbi:hypothetical protein AB0I55_00960 [Actinocatenispora sera]|uniref:hypothetical protein n=1 Tax=Actinocatenispora sera TaxID=390989 RepID=UPI0034006292
MRASHDEPRWPGEHRTVVLYLVAALVSHLADAELSRQLRLRLADISQYAAGLVRRWVAGRVRTPVQDDVAALHHAIVHARGELYSAVAGPAVIVRYLLWTDPLLAVVTVAPGRRGPVGSYADGAPLGRTRGPDRRGGKLGRPGRRRTAHLRPTTQPGPGDRRTSQLGRRRDQPRLPVPVRRHLGRRVRIVGVPGGAEHLTSIAQLAVHFD